jgi:hypothetical protein
MFFDFKIILSQMNPISIVKMIAAGFHEQVFLLFGDTYYYQFSFLNTHEVQV